MPINARFHATNFLRREAQGTLNIFSEGKPARSVSGHLKRAPSVESPRPESKKGIRRSDRTSIVPADSLGLAPPRTVRLVRPRSSTPLADILHNTGPSVVEKMNYRRVPSGDANSVRVLCPDYQADPPRRAHSAPRVRDSVGLLLSDRQGDIPSPRPQSVRTRFESIDAGQPDIRPSVRTARHPVDVPQPSSLFGQDRGKPGLCYWDYKFSALHKPLPRSLIATAPRASTPPPQRPSTFFDGGDYQVKGRRKYPSQSSITID
jgi:hypothetical protein